MKNVKVTEHASKRFEERMNVCDMDEALEIANHAWLKGRKVSKYSEQQRRYIEKIRQRNSGTGKAVRTIANMCFIFSKDAALITLFPFCNRYGEPYLY